jgi:hypothetical protein
MFRYLLIAFFLYAPALAVADSAAALSACVTDNTSGKQRKDLARWVFLAMAAHPELKPYTTPDIDAAREATDKLLAELFVDLITQKCAAEAGATFEERGTAGLQVAFEQLGRVAMLELMSNPDTTAAMSGFEKHLDREKISAALSTDP